MQQQTETPATAACAAATFIQHISPGQLADLRRIEGKRRAPAFWRLAARYPSTIGNPTLEESWTDIIRILAILTPKGQPENRASLHNQRRRLGEVLCDGGNPEWPTTSPPRPALSEHRLMKLLAAQGQQRRVLLTRAARAMARSIQPGSGLNVPDMAFALLSPEESNRYIAEHYYRRLDSAFVAKSAEGTI